MNSLNTQNKTDTLIGRILAVKFEDGSADQLSVRQIRLAEYKKALVVMEDEMEIVAIATDQKKARIETLAPESYEEVQKAVREVNERGFFIYAERRMSASARNLSGLPPEILQRAIDQFISSTSSQRLPGRQG